MQLYNCSTIILQLQLSNCNRNRLNLKKIPINVIVIDYFIKTHFFTITFLIISNNKNIQNCSFFKEILLRKRFLYRKILSPYRNKI